MIPVNTQEHLDKNGQLSKFSSFLVWELSS